MSFESLASATVRLWAATGCYQYQAYMQQLVCAQDMSLMLKHAVTTACKHIVTKPQKLSCVGLSMEEYHRDGKRKKVQVTRYQDRIQPQTHCEPKNSRDVHSRLEHVY